MHMLFVLGLHIWVLVTDVTKDEAFINQKVVSRYTLSCKPRMTLAVKHHRAQMWFHNKEPIIKGLFKYACALYSNKNFHKVFRCNIERFQQTLFCSVLWNHFSFLMWFSFCKAFVKAIDQYFRVSVETIDMHNVKKQFVKVVSKNDVWSMIYKILFQSFYLRISCFIQCCTKKLVYGL